ncbi:FMN-binding protein [Geodermatophilus sp. URMC 64]
MRRIVLWAMSTLTVLVLLFGYRTSTSSQLTTGAVVAAPDAGSGFSASTEPGTADSGTGRTVTGPSADTRWGPVQVQITVADGVLTDVTVVDYPRELGKDRQINARALPVLVQETIDAQSADIDMVTGATVTSEGYLESLQGALDEAGL